MFADGRVQLQVIGGQLRRLPRRIETIGSQLERNVRAEHKDVPRPPGTRMDRFVGRGADDHPGWRGAYRRCGATFGLGGWPPARPDVALLPFLGAVVGLAGMLLVLRPLRTSLMRTTLIAGSWQTIPRREFAGVSARLSIDVQCRPLTNDRFVRPNCRTPVHRCGEFLMAQYLGFASGRRFHEPQRHGVAVTFDEREEGWPGESQSREVSPSK